jgi:hypothetical protein
MKLSRKLLAGMTMSILTAANLQAQCTGGITPTLISHDTTVVGTGTAPYSFVFPKFNPSLGTLTEVRIQSVVSLRYTFSLENTDASPRNIRHWLKRFDDIYSSALLFPINNDYESDRFGPYNLTAADPNDGTGSDYIAVGPVDVLDQDTAVNEVVYNVADFMGPGNVTFDYETSPGTSNTGGTPRYTASITDIIKFNISYVYCSALALVSNSITLTADNAGRQSAMIKWNTSNESQAKSYELMVSEDGKNFKTAVIIPATGKFSNDLGSYQFKYDLSSPASQLYFRVKQLTKDNKIAVTAIKPVSWLTPFKGSNFVADATGSYIITNLPSTGGAAWNVALFGSNGQLLQKDQVKGSVNATLAIKQKLQKGIYIVKATNVSSKELITQKIYIQ